MNDHGLSMVLAWGSKGLLDEVQHDIKHVCEEEFSYFEFPSEFAKVWEQYMYYKALETG